MLFQPGQLAGGFKGKRFSATLTAFVLTSNSSTSVCIHGSDLSFSSRVSPVALQLLREVNTFSCV